jgi:hypothetical protein
MLLAGAIAEVAAIAAARLIPARSKVTKPVSDDDLAVAA